jgi:hypothetical protein
VCECVTCVITRDWRIPTPGAHDTVDWLDHVRNACTAAGVHEWPQQACHVWVPTHQRVPPSVLQTLLLQADHTSPGCVCQRGRHDPHMGGTLRTSELVGCMKPGAHSSCLLCACGHVGDRQPALSAGTTELFVFTRAMTKLLQQVLGYIHTYVVSLHLGFLFLRQGLVRAHQLLVPQHPNAPGV